MSRGRQKDGSKLNDENSKRETKRYRLSQKQESNEDNDFSALLDMRLAESASSYLGDEGHDLASLDAFLCSFSDEIADEIAIEKENAMVEEMRENLGNIPTTIPDEILIGILGYLPCQDLITSSLVSKYFNVLSSDHSLWKTKAQIFGIPIERISNLKKYCLSQIGAIFKNIKGRPGPHCKGIAAEYPSMPFTSLKLFYCFLDYSLDNPERSLPPISEQKFSPAHYVLKNYNLGSIQITSESVNDKKKEITFSTFDPLKMMNTVYQLKHIFPPLASDMILLQLDIAYEDLPLKLSYSVHPPSDRHGARSINIKHFIDNGRVRKDDVLLYFKPREQNFCRELTTDDFFGDAPVPSVLFLAHTVENNQITTQLKLETEVNFKTYEEMGDYFSKKEGWHQALHYYSKIIPIFRIEASGRRRIIRNLINVSDIASSTNYEPDFYGTVGDNREAKLKIRIKMIHMVANMDNLQLAQSWLNKLYLPNDISTLLSEEVALLKAKLQILIERVQSHTGTYLSIGN